MRNLIIIVAVFFVLLFGYNSFITYSVDDSDSDTSLAQGSDSLDNIVLLQAVKEGDDELWRKSYRSARLNKVSGTTIESIGSSLFWDLRNVIERETTYEGQYRWAKAYIAQLKDAQQHSNCFPVSFPLYNSYDPKEMQSLLSKRTQWKSKQAMIYALQHQNADKRSVSRSDKQELWQPVFDKLRTRFGADIGLIDSGATAKNKHQQCAVVIGYFEEVLSRPVNEREILLDDLLNKHISITFF